MKKLLLISMALLAFSVPALAFSLTHRLDLTYSAELSDGWDLGIQGQLRLDPRSDPLGVGLLIRPYIRYTAKLVDSDEISLDSYVRARLPWEIDIAPAPAQPPSFGLNLQLGLDFTYYVSKRVSLLTGVEFDTGFASNGFDYNFNAYTEVDLELEDLTLYSGLSVDDLLSPLAFTYYLGVNGNLTSVIGLNLEAAYDFANASRSDDFSLSWSLSFRLR